MGAGRGGIRTSGPRGVRGVRTAVVFHHAPVTRVMLYDGRRRVRCGGVGGGRRRGGDGRGSSNAGDRSLRFTDSVTIWGFYSWKATCRHR